MNTLSVLIYLSSVSQSLSAFLAFMAFMFFAISAIFAIISIVHYFSDQEEVSNTFRKFLLKFTLPLAFLCAISAIVLPNRQTVLLVAASEYGERIVNSERVNALVDPSVEYLQNWLRSEINKLQQEGTRR